MRREDVAEVLERLPEVEHAKVQLIMSSGLNVAIESVVRLEPHYAVIRGRESGNQDEGRAFFVPYDGIVSMKLERVVKMTEFDEWYSDSKKMQRKDSPGTDAAPSVSAASEAPALDPAEIARQNLLGRIRAARTGMKK